MARVTNMPAKKDINVMVKEKNILSQDEIDALVAATSEPEDVKWDVKSELRGRCRVCGGDVVEEIEIRIATNKKTRVKKITCSNTLDLHCTRCGIKYQFLAKECLAKKTTKLSKAETKAKNKQIQDTRSRLHAAAMMVVNKPQAKKSSTQKTTENEENFQKAIRYTQARARERLAGGPH